MSDALQSIFFCKNSLKDISHQSNLTIVCQNNQGKEGSWVFASKGEKTIKLVAKNKRLMIWLFLNYQKIMLESQNLIKVLLLGTKNQDFESGFSSF